MFPPVGESILARAFPHLPEPLCRDPRDVDQPLLPPTTRPGSHHSDPSVVGGTSGREGGTSNNQGGVDSQQQGGAKPKVLSFSKPRKGHFSYRRKKPDVSAISKLINDSLR